jgi:hypothetical protein
MSATINQVRRCRERLAIQVPSADPMATPAITAATVAEKA